MNRVPANDLKKIAENNEKPMIQQVFETAKEKYESTKDKISEVFNGVMEKAPEYQQAHGRV
jgi:hypothetical protein